MRSTRGWLTVSVAWFIVGGSSPTGRLAWASPVPSSWDGASASASFNDVTQTQNGTTANATAAGTSLATYQGGLWPDGVGIYHVPVSGSLSASASSSADQLLQVSASASVPNPGTHAVGGLFGPVDASASWSNDAVVVSAPTGANLPATVRLNFTLGLPAPPGIMGFPNDYGPVGTVIVAYNGHNLNYTLFNALLPVLGNDVNSPPVPWGHDAAGRLIPPQQSFHIDLPLSKAGVSSPFSVSLQMSPTVALISDTSYSYSGLAANIALTSVTLPDGTSLTAQGDSVSFLSGLSAPGFVLTPVPEPSALAAWVLLAVLSIVFLARRLR